MIPGAREFWKLLFKQYCDSEVLFNPGLVTRVRSGDLLDNSRLLECINNGVRRAFLGLTTY